MLMCESDLDERINVTFLHEIFIEFGPIVVPVEHMDDVCTGLFVTAVNSGMVSSCDNTLVALDKEQV